MYDVRRHLSGRRRLLSGATLLIAAMAATLVVAGLLVGYVYQRDIRPVSDGTAQVYFTVEGGQTAPQIAANLKNQGLIRSERAFEWYLRLNGARGRLQAGTYVLSPSLSVHQIVAKMTGGEVAKNLFTILPGKRLDQLRQAFIKAGYTEQQVDEAFNPANYQGHPALRFLPPGASLEGYLYPDSYERLTNTPAPAIIKAALDEMNKALTAELLAGFEGQGLNVHQAVTLASIIDQEVGTAKDKPMVAQVFLKRLRAGIPLGADPTAVYASVLAGVSPPSVRIEHPYNTRLVTGLPPGPIGNVTILGLEAVANPSPTDYLFFVAGDDGTTHYSRTQAEHDELIRKYCTKLCSQ